MPVLAAIIQKQCVGVSKPGWRGTGPDTEELASKSKSWAETRSADNVRRYTYRTRTNRAFLIYETLFALSPLIGSAVERLAGVPVTNPTFAVAIAACMLSVCLWCW